MSAKRKRLIITQRDSAGKENKLIYNLKTTENGTFDTCTDRGTYWEVTRLLYRIRVIKKTMQVETNRIDINRFEPDSAFSAKYEYF